MPLTTPRSDQPDEQPGTTPQHEVALEAERQKLADQGMFGELGIEAGARILVDDMARRAVRAWLAKQSPKRLEEEMLMQHDLGTTAAESALNILRAWADAES